MNPFGYKGHSHTFSKKGKEEYAVVPRIARSALIGASHLADTPSHISSLLHGRLLKKEESLAHAVESEIDKYTKGKYIPKTDREKIADAITQFSIPGKGISSVLKHAGKAPKLAKFIKPTTAGVAGVGVGQHVLNKKPEDTTNSMAANFLTTLLTRKTQNLGKNVSQTLRKNPDALLHPIQSLKNYTKIRKNPTTQTAIEHEIGNKAGASKIEEATPSKMGLNIESAAKSYKTKMSNEFSKDYSNLEHKLAHKLKANPETHIDVPVKSAAQTLRKSYFNMKDETQKDALLKTAAGKMWLRLLNAPPKTKSEELDFLLKSGKVKNLQNPKLNLAEAKEAEKSIRDLIKTPLGDIGPNEQRILKKAASQLRGETASSISKVDPKLGSEWKNVNKRFSKWQNEDKPILNKINSLVGEPEKISQLALSDLKLGAKPLNKTLSLAEGSKKNNIALGALHQLGNVENKFNMPTFYNNFKGLSVKEQGRILNGLEPSFRNSFEDSLNQYKNYLDISSTPSRLDMARQMFLSPTKNKAVSGFFSSNKKPNKEEMESSLNYIRRHEIPNKDLSSIIPEKTMRKNIVQQSILPSPEGQIEDPDQIQKQSLLSSMSDEELMNYGNVSENEPEEKSKLLSSLSDEELMAMLEK